MFKDLKQFNLPEIEDRVLKFWKEKQIFKKSLKLRRNNKTFRFYEGPPTANGQPGIHHILSRAFKDVILRYKTMRGFFVPRRAGWDTHGLPVEIEVEKELGLKNKHDIEKLGIAEFNEKAKASVWKYQEEWERLTERIGFWLDLKNPYITYKAEYIESLWWIFKEIAKKGLLKKSFKIVPYCPRCQTALSSHEMGQPDVYRKVKDLSIFIKFELKKPKTSGKKEYLLVWTTTPWTLPANVAIAVDPKLTYTKYKIGKEYVWSYNEPPVEDKEGIKIIEKASGKKLVDLVYKPIFKVNGPWLKNKIFYKVYGADFVTTADGTGLVHIAPAFGEDDMNLISRYQKDLVGQIPITIDEKGMVLRKLPGAGKFVREADKDIIDDLKKRGLLLKIGEIEHDYPFCWRCSAPLLYFSKFSWFIEMSKLRNKLLENNKKINWVPEHIKEGRFGEWLKEVKDWAISRDRYWGTPLPIWLCEKCDRNEIVGSLNDLNKLRYSKNNFWILRHGETAYNLKNLIAFKKGKDDDALMTERGKKEIEAAVKKLIRELGKEKLHFIYTSPFKRTTDTAKIIAKFTGAKIIIDKRLGELDCGVFNGRPVKEHRAFFGSELERFNKAPERGETLNDVKRRILEAVSEINSNYKDKNILIISHGDPLWVLEGAVKNLDNGDILKIPYIKTGELRKLDLNNWPYNFFSGGLDLHRPYIDKIYLKCTKCGAKMERVKEVADVWFDSGAMPLAQVHFPFNQGIGDYKKLINKIDFPADYISEGIDQTRGWFYTLLAISTVLELGPSYLNVITLGLVTDKNGQKMSKSKGNTVDSWEMVRKYGADVVRWFFYTVNPAGETKRFDENELAKVLRKFVMIIYNSFVFLETYGVKGFDKLNKSDIKSVLDRWILSKLNNLISETTKSLERYDPGAAGRMIEIFIDDLSRWYIRRSRRRFQKSSNPKDLKIASSVLRHCLKELAKLIAPFSPFFADALYQSLELKNKNSSVHLEDWPEINAGFLDEELLVKMDEIRRIASLVLASRAQNKVRVRQPLRLLKIKSQKLKIKDIALLELLKEEVNVKQIEIDTKMTNEVSLDFEITPELKVEGLARETIRIVQDLRQDAGCVPKDFILLAIEAEEPLKTILSSQILLIKKEVGAKTVEFKKIKKFDAEEDTEIDSQKIWVGIRKI